MKLNRNRVLAGLAATGIAAGTLVGGGVAVASTRPAQAPPSPSATASASGGYNCGHHHGMWSGQNPVLKAVTTYLGISQGKLRNQLESGKSLADVATAQGKSVSGLKDTILTAVTARINSFSGLSADQKTAILGEVKSHLGDIVNATCNSGAGGSGSASPSSAWPSSTMPTSPAGSPAGS
jgi:hypothetical protein